MALKELVYIRDVDNLSDARYCAGMGVELIGFRLDFNQEKALDVDTFKEISNWISGVTIVGEFGDLTASQIEEILQGSMVDYLLATNIANLEKYRSLEAKTILQINFDDSIEQELAELNYSTEAFDYLLITSESEELDEDAKIIMRELAQTHAVILGFGIDKQNVQTIVGELGLAGISMAGSAEIRPGYKDYDELAELLELLEID
jgi:phosphoribosylanthranilate isomerase